MQQPLRLEVETGLIFKEKLSLIVDDKIIRKESKYSNLLRKGESYHQIKKADVLAVKARDSGFKSFRAILLGAFLAVVSVMLFSLSLRFQEAFSRSFAILGGLTAIALIIYGLQKEFSLQLDYLSKSDAVPVVLTGAIEFNGRGTLPIDVVTTADVVFGLNPQDDRELFTFRAKDTFLGISLRQKMLRVGSKTISVIEEASSITSKGFIQVPIKNLIAVEVNPKRFRSLGWGLIGLLIGLFGILIVLSSNDISGIMFVVIGGILVAWGFQSIISVAFSYLVVGDKVWTIQFDGVAIDAPGMLANLGDIAMDAALTTQGEVNIK